MAAAIGHTTEHSRMTWSIVARDPPTGLFGVAVASRFFAVGAICPHARGGTGALSTQALVNPTYGPRALRLLAEGLPAPLALDTLIALDEGRAHRQAHLLDAGGRNAAWTGEACVGWAGHRLAEHVSVAGNMLAGPGVLDATLETYLSNAGLPLAERLLAAMEAGEAAGGDKRGKQSAALLLQGEEEYPRLSLRADDHPEPLAELRRLLAVAHERFIPFSRAFPDAERPYGICERNVIDDMIARYRARRGLPAVEAPPAAAP
jgi:uncharacterized Ntn-hydrolase superfamily protein